MNSTELQAYLYDQIPITQAMGVEVREVAPLVKVFAPLGPNINHRGTGFGGSIASLATVAAWSAVRLAIPDGVRLVIAREEVDFLAPVTGDFHAAATLGESQEAFLANLERRGKARIEVSATVLCGDVVAARFVGRFVAIQDAP